MSFKAFLGTPERNQGMFLGALSLKALWRLGIPDLHCTRTTNEQILRRQHLTSAVLVNSELVTLGF